MPAHLGGFRIDQRIRTPLDHPAIRSFADLALGIAAIASIASFNLGHALVDLFVTSP